MMPMIPIAADLGYVPPTIHDVDNYGRHSVIPGRHTVADLASRALAQTLTRVERDRGASRMAPHGATAD